MEAAAAAADLEVEAAAEVVDLEAAAAAVVAAAEDGGRTSRHPHPTSLHRSLLAIPLLWHKIVFSIASIFFTIIRYFKKPQLLSTLSILSSVVHHFPIIYTRLSASAL